jgi:hypothetical protein
MHVLRIDDTTLPPGVRMIALSHRHAGDGLSQFADVRKGELHRADFAATLSADSLVAPRLRRTACSACTRCSRSAS